MMIARGKTRGLWRARAALILVAFLAACADDPGEGTTPAAPQPLETAAEALVVGGCQCPSWQPGVSCGELSYADIPADDTYYVTTFGGPGDGQDMWICGYKSTANGSWAYMAGHERFGCGKVLIKHPSQDKYCVAEVADCGPNKCVEEAACFCGCGGHAPILDVSPFVTNHLFGITSSGWSEKREVIAWQVDASEPIGCFNGGVGPGTGVLKGVVYEAPDTADRIPGATVTLNTGATVTANGVGYWEFELAPGTYTATAAKSGYLTASQTRSVAAGAEVWGSIGLTPCACDDGNPCTNDSCAGGACAHTNNTKSCNDGNACTTGDVCSGGQCGGGAPLSCDDGNPCTDDGCNPGAGCTHAPNAVPCDDGDACTLGDHCAGGACAGGGGLVCDDGNPCTDDGCLPASGCAFEPNTQPCDDGDPCSVGDACAGGLCAGGTLLVCDDGNPCTDDSCAGGLGCAHVPNAAPCDDGDLCTGGDLCAGGVCAGQDISAACGDGNPCTDDGCVPSLGCVHFPNMVPCDDGDACTAGEVCGAGVCGGGQILACDDGNPCTDDACGGPAGCVSIPNASPCDDGDPCTDVDGCWNGACKGITTDPDACDDGDPCTVDACQAGLGCVHHADAGGCDDGNPCTEDGCQPGAGCVHAPRTGPCDDGDACTWNDHCAAGACAGGQSKICSDGNPCTDDLCDPGSGACVFPSNTAPCDDGDPCTAEDLCEDGECVGEWLPECGVPDVLVEDAGAGDVGPEASGLQDGASGAETPPPAGGDGDGESGPEAPPTGPPTAWDGTTGDPGGCAAGGGGGAGMGGLLLALAALVMTLRRRTRWT